MEIAIISGKGGTGKSSISAAFMSCNHDVTAIDCDVDAANLYLLFHPTHNEEIVFVSGKHAEINKSLCNGCGKCAELCKFDAITLKNKKPQINEVSCEGCALCYRECPQKAIKMIPDDKSRIYKGDFRFGKMIYGRLAPGEENSGKMVSLLREYNNFNKKITILDGPPGIGCPVLSTITGVDKVVVVTEPTRSGFSDMERAINTVKEFSIPTYVIINKCTLNLALTDEISEWCKSNNIPVIAALPFEKKMVDAMVVGKTILEYAPNSETSKILKEAYNKLIV